MNNHSLSDLLRSHQVALTTLAATDQEYCDRLQNSLVRGVHELLYWGVGPMVRRGDIVALYMPKSEFLPDCEHSCIRRLYFAAADSTVGSVWRQHVFLSRRVDLEPAVTYQELTESVGMSFHHITGAGRTTKTLDGNMSRKLLTIAGERCHNGLPGLCSQARHARNIPRVCISYSGQDWTQAHRLKLWLDAAGLDPFFVSPVGGLLSIEERPLNEFLVDTFSHASVVVCLVPATPALSYWIKLELEAALEHAKRLILVRADKCRPWPIEGLRKNVQRYTLGQAQERELVRTVKRELATVSG